MPSTIPIAPPFRYALNGRVVTLGPQGTLADGTIYVADGEIHAVQPAAAPPPAGFEGVPVVRTGDTLYPGLIELHNHLAYNAVPLWQLPRRYSNNQQWRGTHEYRRHVTGPAKVLGSTDGLVAAVIRFVECRSLLGGTTTSQGITLIGVGTKELFPGLVRNVEDPGIPGLPAAACRIGNPPSREDEKAGYLERQVDAPACYLQHLSEGVDATARGWFHRLRRDDDSWALHHSFCGIHSTALTREDFDVVVEHGGSMVWSPLSNYLLYGATADLAAVRGSGIKVGLGSDWAPSGSKSLLGELKVAWLASQEAGGVFTAEELVRMATVDAAGILGWDGAVGTLEPGKRADVVAVNGKTGDPFMQLIEARETSITLVVIDGVPRVGQHRLMNRFELDHPEEVRVGSSERTLHLAQENVHPLVRDLTLGRATEQLADALARLPEMASAIDGALLGGLAAGDAGSPLSPLRLDLELDDEPLEALAGSLADDLFPMELEAITVADDPTFLPKMMAARNLPEFIKQNLPGLYGEPVPAPFEAEERRVWMAGLPPRVNATVGTLRHFLDSWRKLTLEERKTLVNQALVLLEQSYVHLPFKRAMHGVDPVQRLRLLRYQLDQQEGRPVPPDVEFHAEMTRIFHSLRDLHTTYRLPNPFRGAVAWLPFFVEEHWDDAEGRNRYLISKVVGEGDLRRLEGAEVLHWNGVPIETAIAVNADRQAGSNPDARHARGLNSLTIRPLGRGLPPDEDWVTLRYRNAGGTVRESRHEWLVFVPESALERPDPAEAEMGVAAALGLDDHTDDVQEAKKVLFASRVWERERASAPGVLVRSGEGALETTLPTVFRARVVESPSGPLGHLRIFTFNVSRAAEFVEELGRLVEQLPENGLILDVRGNGGGLIPAAEGALQLFTSRRIEPQRAQFINTPTSLALCEMHPDDRPGSVRLGRWVESIRGAVQTGTTYSLGFPITEVAELRGISQRYFGPVVLVTDALCYSATDMFAAGFQDHEIGPVVGVHGNTGAGGANVWSHGLLRRLWRADAEEPSPFRPLPEGADFRVAVRRTLRVGLNAGGVVEDLGIRPDERHRTTRRDLLSANEDLIETAARTLVRWHAHRTHIQVEKRGAGLPRVSVSTPDDDLAELTVSLHLRTTVGCAAGERVLDLAELLADPEHTSVDVEVRGLTELGGSFSCHAELERNPVVPRPPSPGVETPG